MLIVPLHQISKSIQTATLAPLWRHSRENIVKPLNQNQLWQSMNQSTW